MSQASRPPNPDDMTQAARDDDAPTLGPSDASDTGSDVAHGVNADAEEDTLPLPPRAHKEQGPEDEDADPVGHGETEPDGSPLPPPTPIPPWRRGTR